MMNSEKENKAPRRSSRAVKTPNAKPNPFPGATASKSRDLTITRKLLQDLSGKANLSLVTSLNLQFKDERFPKIKVPIERKHEG